MIADNAHIRRRASGAFSLLELVLVLAIIAVFAAIASPRYAGSAARYRADAAARRIVADLDLARETAYTSSEPTTVKFDTATETLVIPGVKGLRSSLTDYETFLAEDPYGADLVSVDFDGEVGTVFDIYGKPHAAGTILIQVGDTERVIVVDQDTGKASIQ